MKIFVILLNWNGKDDTLNCLRSLNKIETPHHIIVVDNGSVDDSVLAIHKEFKSFKIISKVA